MTITEAKALRAVMTAAAESLIDAQGSTAPDMFPRLKGNGALISAGTRINWQGVLKRAAADLWDTAENTPDAAPTLWEDISYYRGYRVIPETITATLAFSAGEIGYWRADDAFYRAKNDGTVWTPAAYPDAWESVDV